jgi:hypothetical protein
MRQRSSSAKSIAETVQSVFDLRTVRGPSSIAVIEIKCPARVDLHRSHQMAKGRPKCRLLMSPSSGRLARKAAGGGG